MDGKISMVNEKFVLSRMSQAPELFQAEDEEANEGPQMKRNMESDVYALGMVRGCSCVSSNNAKFTSRRQC